MKKITLCTCFVIFMASCSIDKNPIEESSKIEEVEISEDHKSSEYISTKYISSEEIPQIMSFLSPQTDPNSKSTLVSTPVGSLEIENILQVIDSLGNKNYSFLIIPETHKPNSIFNLIVSNSGKKKQNIAILEYRMNEDFAEAFRKGNTYFSQFQGIIYKYSFGSFSDLFKASCVQNIDEMVICDEVPVSSGGSGGGGGDEPGYDPTGSEDGYEGGTGNYSGGSGGSISVVWVCNKYSFEHSEPSPACGDGSGTWIITFNSHTKSRRTSANKELTCCDDSYVEGSIGINLVTNAISNIYNCIGSTPQEMAELNSINVKPMKTIKLSMYLSNNNCSEESKEFGALAKEAIVAGGDVDYENNVIFHSSFINSVGKCVYDYIKQKNGTLFRSTIKNFVDNEEYDLTFKVHSDPNDVGAARTDGSNIENGMVTIKFNTAYQSSNPMEWASSIFHEGLHAEIYRFVDAQEPGINPGDRERIMQLFLFYKETEWGDDATVQHMHMSENYVIPFAKALREIDNSQYSLDYYMYFAWDGLLDDTPVEVQPSSEEMTEWANKAVIVRTNNNIPCP